MYIGMIWTCTKLARKHACWSWFCEANHEWTSWIAWDFLGNLVDGDFVQDEHM
jgi:hypothetical protein